MLSYDQYSTTIEIPEIEGVDYSSFDLPEEYRTVVIPDPFLSNTLEIYLNGIMLIPGEGADYTLEDNRIVFNPRLLVAGDYLRVSYLRVLGLNSEFFDFTELEAFWRNLFIDFGILKKSSFTASIDSHCSLVTYTRSDRICIRVSPNTIEVFYKTKTKDFTSSMDYFNPLNDPNFLTHPENFKVYLSWVIHTISTIKRFAD